MRASEGSPVEMQMLQPGWEDRVKLKLSAAALVSAVGSAQAAASKGRSIIADVPRKTAGYTGAMALFCAIQEGLRAVRGTHDALNSFAAGVVAGSLVVGHYQGAQYRALGAVIWGPLCGVAHVLNSALQPRIWIEDALIDNGLLSPIVAERRPPDLQGLSPHKQVEAVYKSATKQAQEGRGGLDMDSLRHEAERIRDFEMKQLAVRLEVQSRRSHVDGRVAGAAPHQHNPTDAGSSSSGGQPAGAEGGSGSSAGSGATAATAVSQPGGWWAWMMRSQGKGDTSGSGKGTGDASSSSSNNSSISSQQAKEGSDQSKVEEKEEEEDDFDEEDFQQWLASSKASPEGLVLPRESEGYEEVKGKRNHWWNRN